MSDQAQNAVETDPETDLIAALGKPETEAAEDAAAPEARPEDTPAEEPEKYLVKLKNERGEDEEREVSVEELAKGYMLQADYTRKTQEVATQRQNLDVKYQQALQQQQSQAVEQINRLQELVLTQAAPELNGVDWVSLSVQDPARFVQLQARQQQVQQTLQALEQQKAQHQQAREQAIAQSVDQVLRQSDEVLKREIPDFDAQKTEALLGDVEKHLGWSRRDLHHAAQALATAGMRPDTLGKVLVAVHKSIQYDALQQGKPAALKKVAEAPKLIKPGATQPKQPNRDAVARLQKTGRLEDLARLL